jgi:hypothetical protein
MELVLARLRDEIERTVFFPPPWALESAHKKQIEAIAKAVGEEIEARIRDAVGDMVQRAFEESILRVIYKGMNPIVVEFARFRRAFENDMDGADWWKDLSEDDPDAEDVV